MSQNRQLILSYLSVILLISACGDSGSNSGNGDGTGGTETGTLDPGSEIVLPASDGGTVDAVLLDGNNDGTSDGIDFDGDGNADVALLPTGDNESALGFDADGDGNADYYLIVTDDGVELNTEADGSGQTATLVTDSEGVTGVDADGDGESDTDIEEVEDSNSAATPGYSPAAGGVTTGTTVTISTTTGGATIYYTTGDGTQADPDCSSGSSGTAGTAEADVVISADTTIKSVACLDGLDISSVSEAAYTIYSITSVTPDNGLASATASVTITGTGFTSGNDATVNGNDGDCTFQNSTTLTCNFPDNSSTVETVDVELTHSNGTSDTLTDGFTYTGVLADPGISLWCGLQSPASTTTTVSVATASIYGQIYVAGVTESAGAGTGIEAQLGYGADGVSPETTNFTWIETVFDQQVGNNDEFVATLTIGTAGTYDYAYRFTQDGGLNYYYCDTVGGGGSDDGYSAANAGDLTVNP